MAKFNILRILESTLPTLSKIIGRVYYCQDTGNLYIDTKIGRIPQVYTLIRTELERQRLSPETGYYYIYETNVLWVYSNSWRVFAENKYSYPAEYTDRDNASYNIFADSLNLLVNENKDNIGSLIINPEISLEVLDDNNNLERVVKSHDFGKLIFNGDICYKKDGKLTTIKMDDGCIDYLDPSDNELNSDMIGGG